MGPEQKREELLVSHSELLTQTVRNHTEPRLDKKDHHYIKVKLEPYGYKEGDDKLDIAYYPSGGAGKRAALIILPMLGGISMIERGLARFFSDNGLPSLILSVPEQHRSAIKDALTSVKTVKDVPYLTDIFNDVHRKEILSVMRVVDWIHARPELDGDRIGGLGISLGAILLSSIMGVYGKQKYIKAGASILGGAGLNYIIAHSLEPGIKRDRGVLLEALDRDEDWLEEQLYGEFPWDPLHHAHNIDPKTMMVVIAKGDHYVPTKTGWDLANAIGNPKVTVIGSMTRHLPIIDGHLAAFFKRGKVENEALEFFRKRLNA